MSAMLQPELCIQAMQTSDIDEVMDIEREVYEFPWTWGNFNDSLRAGYSCRVLRLDGLLIGYCVVMKGLDEAHLLNLSVSASHQRHGYGRMLLSEVMRIASDHAARILFLEVRPGNAPARRLYEASGFRQIGVRRGYYPARDGREDALVLSVDLGGEGQA
jgi:ribosomal-protein-alanine N-acetyltransferase